MEKSDKKFKPQSKPFMQNAISSTFNVFDEENNRYFAKAFVEKKLDQLNLTDAIQFNQSVLSDLSDQIFPQHFLQIQYTYAIPQGFIFVTETYQMTLQKYLNEKCIEQIEALEIFEQILKCIYSLYNAGFWHRNVRPEHFVRKGKYWKLQSLVYNNQYLVAKEIQNEYLWNPSYQPPQAYTKQFFIDEELDEMIVWNLGSLLIDILLGHHKLKNQTVMNNFKNKPFSFAAIKVKKTYSKQLESFLGRMLHYNPKQRMTINQLFSLRFFSQHVSKINQQNFQMIKSSRQSGRNILQKSLRSSLDQQNLILKDFDKLNKQYSSRENTLRASYKDSTQNNKLATNQQMYDAILKISNRIIEENQMRSGQILSKDAQKVFDIYKSQYDKCELLLISVSKILNMSFQQNQIETKLLIQYALTFNSMLYLHQLVLSINKNKNFFDVDSESWTEFQGSAIFKSFKQLMNVKLRERNNIVFKIKQKIEKYSQKQQLKSVKQFPPIKDFLNQQYDKCTFQKIKASYRRILHICYNITTKQFNSTRQQKFARLAMYITYCWTIDKLYIKTDIIKNFRMFFQWMNRTGTNYISLQQFQQYIDNADPNYLVNHSVTILKTYFNV